MPWCGGPSFYNCSVVLSRSYINMSVQFSSVAQSCPTLCNPMSLSMPGLPVHHHLLEFTQTHVHWGRDAIQPSHPPSSPSPPASSSSQQQSLFQWVNSSMRWPKYLSFSFSIIPSKEIQGLISFRMDWFLSGKCYWLVTIAILLLIVSRDLNVICYFYFIWWLHVGNTVKEKLKLPNL